MDLGELLRVTRAVVDVTLGTEGATVPKKFPACSRGCGLALCVPLCGACFVWSALWRVLLCPFQCLCSGPGAALSNNGCTDVTDACITRYVGEVNADAAVWALSAALATPSSPETREAFAQVLASLRAEFADQGRSYTTAHYTLCYKVVSSLSGVPVLPGNAAAIIDDMIAALGPAGA